MFRRLPGMISALVLAAAAPALAHPGEHPTASRAAPPAPADAARVVDAFHAALARGDTAAALELLADEVLIFEAGGAESSKAEYAAQHLPADAAFAQAVPGAVVRRTGGRSGGFAWVASEGRAQGRYKDREVDRVTTETMLLRQVGGAWKIVHVHWSSRAAKP